MILQVLSSCLANQSKAETSSLLLPPRALRPVKKTPGTIFHFHSAFESQKKNIWNWWFVAFVRPVYYLIFFGNVLILWVKTNTLGKGSRLLLQIVQLLPCFVLLNGIYWFNFISYFNSYSHDEEHTEFLTLSLLNDISLNI